MKYETNISHKNVYGTSLRGYVTTTRRVLEEAFGEPVFFGEGDKVTVEWMIRFEDGSVATVYDWKRYEEGTPDMDEVLEWNIGGKHDGGPVVDYINDIASLKSLKA